MNRAILASGLGLVLATSALLSLPGTIARAADADAPARNPEVWAVIVGIDRYDDPGIPRCRGTIRDGGALARWFTETARWDSPHVLLMNENGIRRPGRPEDPIRALIPTRENLDWAVREWLGHRLRPGDVAVVYFAGQSAVVDDRELLLPIDAKAGNLERTGWAPEEAVDDLAQKTRASLVFWLDAAALERGPAGGVRPAPVPAPDSTAGVHLLNRLSRWPGASAWRTYGRPAADVDGEGYGPFLSALARGLGARPGNLLSCLDQMRQDPALEQHGFRARGGIAPALTLWPGHLLPEHQFRPTFLLQQGHADAVTAVAFAADGETMITASQDSTVRIWRVRDGVRVLIRVLSYHTIGVTALAMSPDGRLVASGDGAGRVRVWDLAEQREKPHDGASPHHQRITGLAFLPDRDGARFVSLDQGGRSVLWNTAGRLLKDEPFLEGIELVRLAAASREGPAALALADPAGRLIPIGGDGKPRRLLDGTGGRPSALHLSADGRRLAVGDEAGRVQVWDVETRAAVFRHDYPGKIGAIRIGPAGGLAVGAGNRMYLAELDRDGPGPVLEGVGDEVDSALFSGDGRWLSALTTNGNCHLWAIADRSRPLARTPAVEGRSAGVACLSFSPDDRGLFAGEGDGSIRGWDLPACRERLRIPAHRGKVEGLCASADGRFLLQITRDERALIWDLMEGRGARTLPGRWTSGAFLPDGSRLAMTRGADRGGDVVLIDRESGRTRLVFERPRARGGQEVSRAVFGRVAVAGDGRTVAAATAAGQVEMACVWDVQGGPPRVLRGHTGPITALAFAGDGRSLLTASEDRTARLWDLAPDGPAPGQPSLTLKANPARPITAAQINPANPRQVVTAHWAPGQFGQLFLWDWQPGQPPPRPRSLGEISGRPHALAFSSDGRWVAAAGDDKRLSLWALEPGRAPSRVLLEPEHQHAEQVNALAAWSTAAAPLIASGSDDTTVRLWSLDAGSRRGTLLGTLVAVPAAPEEDAGWDRDGDRGRGRFASASPAPADWVAFTPDGVYDSSLDGDRMVSFVLDREVRPLEQYAGQFHKFQLTDDLRRGTRPQPPAHTAPPALVIDPPQAPDLRDRDAELRISASDLSLSPEGLRLYQNGVPVQDGRDFRVEGRGKFAARVRLRRGENRFYAMASRQGDIDARSRDVVIPYDGQETAGQFHVLAIGVKDYARNALRYASNDAVEIAGHLHRYGVEGADRPGKKIVLTDGHVTEESVDVAFTDLRRAVKGRPEDTVVVFLAGHTDVLKDPTGRERFSLLLPSFPFPLDAPALASNRGVGIGGPSGGSLPAGADLPFYVIYRNLGHLDALQRLVIIDACQAEAIYNDPGVRQIRQVLEKDTHRSRTSYLLAARRGEPANESALLEHGLLTYVLLRGMEAPGLRPLPIPLPLFEEAPNADEDGDGVVTTRELRTYAERALPALASRLPDLAQRSGIAGSPSPSPSRPEPVRIQASEGTTFRLITLPKEVGGGR